MGYYASGYGSITVRTDYDTPTLHKRYKRKTIDFCDGRKKIEANTLLDLILDHDQGFEDIQISKESEGTAVLDLSASEKYHGDLVMETLDRLAPITIEGEIRFSGEDDCQWCFHCEKGKFLEYDGLIVFDCDHPYCSKKDCIFSDGERCRAQWSRVNMPSTEPLTGTTSPSAHAIPLLSPASPRKYAVIFGDNLKKSDDIELFFHVN